MGDPPTSVSRCHGDAMGRRIARTGRTRRTARPVSLSKSAVSSLPRWKQPQINTPSVVSAGFTLLIAAFQEGIVIVVAMTDVQK